MVTSSTRVSTQHAYTPTSPGTPQSTDAHFEDDVADDAPPPLDVVDAVLEVVTLPLGLV